MPSKSLVGHIVLPEKTISGQIEFDSHITDIKETILPKDVPYIFPAFIDIHTHGCNTHSVMDGTSDAVLNIAQGKAAQGVSHFLPTTLTSTKERILTSLEAIQQAHSLQKNTVQYAEHADIIGIHFEGPYLSKSKYKGSQNVKFIRDPNIIEFNEFWERSGKLIKLATVAPELHDGLDFIRELTKRGIRISAGHTAASAKEFKNGVGAGVVSATHLFNGMKEFSHYDLGVAGSVLIDDNLYCEVIGDGHHVVFDAFDIVIRCKPKNKIMCITDSSCFSGMPDGMYVMEDLSITVKNGIARTTEEGGLAGSLIKMDEILKNLVTQFSDIQTIDRKKILSPKSTLSLSDISRMMSQNQAEFLGLERVGKIEKNYEANFAVLDSSFNLLQTIKKGQIIYTKKD